MPQGLALQLPVPKSEITRDTSNGVNPLLLVKSNDQLDQDRNAKDAANEAAQREQPENLSKLAAFVRDGFEDAKKYRSESGSDDSVDDLLLKCLRQSNDQYEPDIAAILSDRGQSERFLGLTGKKERDAQAWIMDVSRVETGVPFKVSPTPVPDMGEELTKQVADRVMQDLMFHVEKTGEPVTLQTIYTYAAQLRDEVDGDIEREAKIRCNRMQSVIMDTLAQGGWAEAWNGFVQNLTQFPTAFIKGPVMRKKVVLAWRKTSFGMQPVREKRIVHTFETPSPFDIYPSRETTDVQTGTFFERIKLSPASLSDMIGVPGYQDDAIEKILALHRPGVYRELTSTDSDRKALEDKGSNTFQAADFIEGVEMWGMATGVMLKEYQIEEDMDGEKINPFKVYDINAILIGSDIIYVSLNPNPSGARPMHMTSWDKRHGSFWGRSIPSIMDGLQGMVNATGRSIEDNESVASGFQVIYNDISRIPAGEDITSLYPGKIHQFVNTNPTNAAPPMTFTQPESNAAELISVYQQLATMVDEYTGIPAYVSGSTNVKGAGRTSSGLAMLMGNSARGIKRVLLNIDQDIFRPVAQFEFDWQMLFSEDEEIKGDAQIVCAGTLAEVIRGELNAARQTYLQTTLNPIDAQIIGVKGRAAIHREIVRSLEMPVHDIVPDDEELDQRAASAATAAQGQGQVPAMEAGQSEGEVA